MSTILSLIFTSAANVIDAVFYMVYLLLIVRFVMNFYVEKTKHPGVVFVFRSTELILDPVRQKLGLEFRIVDGALIAVFLFLVFIQGIVVGLIRNLAAWFGS